MKKSFWSDKNVLVTGGSGFLGKHVIFLLKKKNPKKITVVGSKDFDLRKYKNCVKAIKGHNLIIHLAANVGGIGYNQLHPAELFEDNLFIGLNTMKAAKDLGVSKFVAVGTVCAYPKFAEVPFKEDSLWSGYPEETNAPYGLAKKMMLVQAQVYRKQFGFNAIYLLPVNLYGPHDNFDPKSSHVIPALIRKFVDAKKKGDKSVKLWGTGKATREFIYVDDAARGILLASEMYEKADPVNLGTGLEIPISDLAKKIREIISPEVKIIWDKSKPDGQPRRVLNIEKAKKEFGFVSNTSFDAGIKKTVSWYLTRVDRK